ncbi:MAG: hypothetical protein IJV40_16220, partial [Oscillospiraceae bacterium]|nr:hypothetical protein [Oscillospiraceae bacterium]
TAWQRGWPSAGGHLLGKGAPKSENPNITYILCTMFGAMLPTISAEEPYNPEKTSFLAVIKTAARELIRLAKLTVIPAVMYSVYALFSPESTLKRKARGLHIYLWIQSGLLAISAYQTRNWICGAVYVPLTVATFPIWIMAIRKRQQKTAACLYVLGILYAMSYILTSNTGADAGMVGFCMSAAGGLWLCSNMLKETSREKSAEKTCRNRAVLIVLITIVLTPAFCQRVIGVYRDAPLTQLNTRLNDGPAKGLYTTPEHAEQYKMIYSSLKQFAENESTGKILVSKNLPWAYVQLEKYENASFSSWRVYTDIIKQYYSIHPENRADYICILEEHVAGWEESPFNRNPGVSSPNAMDYNDVFWEQVMACPIITQTEYLCIYDVRELWS